MIRIKKGNGTMIFGTFVMISVAMFIIYFINLASMRQYHQLTQLAADSLADSLAVKMKTGGESYEDAHEEALHLVPLVSKATGIHISKYKIDKKEFEDNTKIAITVETKAKTPITISSKMDKTYTMTAKASTIFDRSGLGNAKAALEWGATNIGVTTYSMNNRMAGLNAQGKIISTDCSGFVWWCYKKMGLKDDVPMWYTGNMSNYFDRIPPSAAKPGDALFCTGPERGSGVGHARIYIGNNKCLHCTSGGVNGVQYYTIDMNNLGPYHFGRIKSQFMK